jgi:hypothetical protein
MWVLKIRKGVVQGHLDPQILSMKRLKKRRKFSLILRILDSKSDHLVTFWTECPATGWSARGWERFGVDDGVFRLVNEVEEGVDGAENELEALKKKEMLISFLFWFTSQIFMQL